MARKDRALVNKFETNFSILYRNQSYGIFELFPPFPVDSESGSFYKYKKGDYFTVPKNLERAEDGTAVEIKRKPTEDTYRTREKAARTWSGDIAEMLADQQVRPSRTLTLDVLNAMHLTYEIEGWLFATDTARLTENTTLVGGQKFSDYLNSDPETVFSTIKLGMLPYLPYGGGLPNAKVKAFMPPNVFETMIRHPQFKEQYKNTDGQLGKDKLAEFMRVNEVVIVEAYKNTATEITDLDSPTLEPVMGDDIVIAYVDATKRLDTITFGFSPVLRMPDTKGVIAASPEGTWIRVRDYDDNAKGGGGFWREADGFWDMKIVMPELAHLIKDVI